MAANARKSIEALQAPDLPRPFRVPLGGLQVGRAWIGYIPAVALARASGPA